MTSPEDKITINLLIGKQTHRISVNRDNEAIFRRAAENVNQVLAKYEEAYPYQNTERYLSSAILQFAVRSLQLESEKSTEPFLKSIEVLIAEIEETLKEI